MLAIVLICVGVSAAFVLLFLLEIVPGRNQLVADRLAELQNSGRDTPAVLQRRRRQARTDRLKGVLQAFGEAVQERSSNTSELRQRLIRAGYPNAAAVPMFMGSRLALPAGLFIGAGTLLPTLGYSAGTALVMSFYFGAMGYVVPGMLVTRRVKKRQKEMQRALPDALDMLVVSVEAGLGLNAALVRVSDEIDRLSPVLSEQLGLVNLEIRAGTSREDALRNLADRTGLQDISSLVGMLIQTDRFGTSVAQALRVHADTMRTKRRQRAEEAAAKTTIKLVFPLVFCIFPAMFVVILGPALIQIYKALGGFGGVKYLRAENPVRGSVLGTRIALADRWWYRLRGLHGRPQLNPGEGMMLRPCRAVHMFGMSFPLDVAFLDGRGGVVASYRVLPPGRRTRWHPDAADALELPAGILAATGTLEGDTIVCTEVEP